MMTFFRMLRNTVILALLPWTVFAQVTADELLDDYVSASVNGENAIPFIAKINQTFKSYRDYDQALFLVKISERINKDTIVNQQNAVQKIVLIDLYALLADKNDGKLDDLFFQKGEICGLHTGDTIMLKECIAELKLSNQCNSPRVHDYITSLQDYLEQIRNIFPVSQRIDGIWISEIMYNMNYVDECVYYTPSFVINIKNGQAKLENIGYSLRFADVGFWNNKVKNDENTYAQNVVDIGGNRVYMAWSNEKLNIPNQSIALSLEQIASDISTNVVTEATSNLIGNVGGDVVGGIAGNIIAGAIKNMFAPSKKIYVLEMELELINDYEMIGKQCLKVITIDGNGKPDIFTENQELYFIKYDIESGVYFGSSGNKYKYIPEYGLSKVFPSKYKQLFTELAKKYQKGLYSRLNWNLEKFQSSFCIQQILKLIYYNDQKMLREGCKMSERWHQYPKEAYLGIYMHPIDKKRRKTPNNIKGVYVYDIDNTSPAYLFGIKKNDIILSADGFEIENGEQLSKYIDSLHPYDWTTLHICRGKKEIDIVVELTWRWKKEG